MMGVLVLYVPSVPHKKRMEKSDYYRAICEATLKSETPAERKDGIQKIKTVFRRDYQFEMAHLEIFDAVFYDILNDDDNLFDEDDRGVVIRILYSVCDRTYELGKDGRPPGCIAALATMIRRDTHMLCNRVNGLNIMARLQNLYEGEKMWNLTPHVPNLFNVLSYKYKSLPPLLQHALDHFAVVLLQTNPQFTTARCAILLNNSLGRTLEEVKRYIDDDYNQSFLRLAYLSHKGPHFLITTLYDDVLDWILSLPDDSKGRPIWQTIEFIKEWYTRRPVKPMPLALKLRIFQVLPYMDNVKAKTIGSGRILHPTTARWMFMLLIEHIGISPSCTEAVYNIWALASARAVPRVGKQSWARLLDLHLMHRLRSCLFRVAPK